MICRMRLSGNRQKNLSLTDASSLHFRLQSKLNNLGGVDSAEN